VQIVADFGGTIDSVKNLAGGEFFGVADRMVRVTDGVTVSLVQHDRRLPLPRHRHELARICIILSGNLEENHGLGFEEFSSGWILFWPPGVVHEDQFGPSRNRTLQIEFSRSFYSRKIASFFPRASPSPVRVSALEDAVPHLCSELLRSDAAVSLAVEGAVYEIVARTARLKGNPAVRPLLVERATAYIDGHLDGPIRPSDVAAAVGAKTSSLNRQFHGEFGFSPTQYIRTQRVRRAEAMVRGTGHPIAEIAAQLGYYDSAHMTRDFRWLLGTTPTACREVHLCRKAAAFPASAD
jgi:AraC-like DNA-binding protein